MKKNITYLTILFLLLVLNSCSCIKWNGEKPKGLIDKNKAKTLNENYINNQYRFINNAINGGAEIIGNETPSKKENDSIKEKGKGFYDDGKQGYITPKGGLNIRDLYLNNSKSSHLISENIITTKAFGNKIRDIKDSYEVQFSSSDIGWYLNKIQDYASSKRLRRPGIRIYFGSYIENSISRTTIFLVPTHYIGPTNPSPEDLSDPDNHQNIYDDDLPYLNYGNSGQPPVEFRPN